MVSASTSVVRARNGLFDEVFMGVWLLASASTSSHYEGYIAGVLQYAFFSFHYTQALQWIILFGSIP